MGRPSSEQALIVLDRTEVTRQLIEVVRWRARQRSYSFTLLVLKLVEEELSATRRPTGRSNGRCLS